MNSIQMTQQLQNIYVRTLMTDDLDSLEREALEDATEFILLHSVDHMKINDMRNELMKHYNVFSASNNETDNIEAVGMLHALSIVNKYFPEGD